MEIPNKLIGGLLCAAVCVFVAGRATAHNLVLNPGFETGDTTSWLVLGSGVGASVAVQSGDNGPSAAGSFRGC